MRSTGPAPNAVLCAASIEQARIVFRFAREVLEPSGEYRFLDSTDSNRDHAQGDQTQSSA